MEAPSHETNVSVRRKQCHMHEELHRRSVRSCSIAWLVKFGGRVLCTLIAVGENFDWMWIEVKVLI